MSGSNLLVVVSGSIAAYKACEVISQLVQRGHAVRVVATRAALNFVGPATFEGLTGQPVLTDLFAAGAALEHINLTRWAALTLVCPATANLLNRMAAGLADDLAASVLLAHDRAKPLLVAPAMNPAMWSHPATAASVARLTSWGVQFLPVGAGRTACGEVGDGRLAEPAEIVAAVTRALTPPASQLRVLITSGGTSEPIDGVRVITNTSSGETGARMAEHFAAAGHLVTLLRAERARAAFGVEAQATFGTFAELAGALERALATASFDVVIQAAAVSDFSVAAVEVEGRAVSAESGKLASSSAPVIRLQPNPKLLDRLRRQSRNKRIRVVGFKLTRGASAVEAEAAVRAQIAAGGVDFVVHNDLAARGPDGAFPAVIWSGDGQVVARCADRAAIGPALERLLLAPAERR